MQERTGLGSAIFFTFLTYFHIVRGHQGCHEIILTQQTAEDQPSQRGQVRRKVTKSSLQRASSHSVIRLSRRMSLNGVAMNTSSRSLTLLRHSDEAVNRERASRPGSPERLSERD